LHIVERITSMETLIQTVLIIVGAYLLALWVAAIWWTYRDIRNRTRDILLQLAATLMVAIFSFPGLLLYQVLRPPKTLAEVYAESLEEEALLQYIEIKTACPRCKFRTEEEFIYCPNCSTQLKRLCTSCRRPMSLRWNTCPYCGEGVDAVSTPREREREREPAQSQYS
jgi:RNA polymerase subunit RPABC4/transcription elongation factor Spt4